MAARTTNLGSKVIAAIFTGIVAPVVVDITVKTLSNDESRPVHSPTASHEEEQSRPPSRTPHRGPTIPTTKVSWSRPEPEITQVIVKGSGKTSQAALHDALRLAVSQAMAAQVPESIWTRHGPVLVEDALRKDARLIVGWRELSSTRQWKVGGTMYYSEIAVEIDRRVLLDRVRSLPVGI